MDFYKILNIIKQRLMLGLDAKIKNIYIVYLENDNTSKNF